MAHSTALIDIQALRTRFFVGGRSAAAVDGVDLTVQPGETLGIVGESGSGKSVTALSILRLLGGIHRVDGRILLNGQDVLTLPPSGLRAIRGSDVSMIFQDPMTSLNPVIRIGRQLTEGMRVHGRFTPAEARDRAVQLLKRMGIGSPERVMNGYPHELSGGMRQRVMLAIGFANRPKLIIADEPTTALDVTVQAQILELLKEVSREEGVAVILISHDLGVIASVCSRVAVMYGGEVVEQGPTRDLLKRPGHPYTRALLNAAPHIDSEPGSDRRLPAIGGMPPDILDPPSGCRFAARCAWRMPTCDEHPSLVALSPDHRSRCWLATHGRSPDDTPGAPDITAKTSPLPVANPASASESPPSPEALLEVRGLAKHFEVRGDGLFSRSRTFRAVDGVDFSVHRGEMVGLVGESGCGKSTVARLLTRLHTPTEGSIRYDGQEIATADAQTLRPLRRRLQMIFQDPYASLNPRMNVADILREPIRFHGLAADSAGADRQVALLLDQVGLPAGSGMKYPHEFSGGQRQRIGIARALAVRPEMIVADEPIAALDVNIQAQIINLLLELQSTMRLTCLFIAHDLAVVRQISDRILVMYLGVIVESGPAHALFAKPLHPYTRSLISAIPVHDPDRPRPPRIPLLGEAASSMNPPSGCRFHPRCPHAAPVCRETVPVLRNLGDGRQAACHFAGDLR